MGAPSGSLSVGAGALPEAVACSFSTWLRERCQPFLMEIITAMFVMGTPAAANMGKTLSSRAASVAASRPRPSGERISFSDNRVRDLSLEQPADVRTAIRPCDKEGMTGTDQGEGGRQKKQLVS